MPITTVPVKPFIQPPYRGKITEGGGVRKADDWANVLLHFTTDCKHLVVHEHSLYSTVVLEIHDETSKDGTQQIENCRMESFELTSEQRMELAVYLLSTVTVK